MRYNGWGGREKWKVKFVINHVTRDNAHDCEMGMSGKHNDFVRVHSTLPLLQSFVCIMKINNKIVIGTIENATADAVDVIMVAYTVTVIIIISSVK